MEQLHITETELWAYISKSADTKTIQKVKLWINSTDFDETLYNNTLAIYNLTVEQNSSVEKAKNQFFERVNATEKSKSIGWKNMFKYAAILAIVITGTFVYQQFFTNDNRIIVQTTFGEQKTIKLKDGSTVWLNASSSLSYEKGKPRTLYLVGEGFFEVSKDKNHPFTVTTSDHIAVKVLGTSFNVKSYAEQLVTEIKLLTGKVEVSSDKHFNNKVLMMPNDKVSFNRSSKEVVKSIMLQNENRIAWKEGKIQFKNKSFKDIANDLEIQFNIKIRFENEQIANSKFTISLNKTTPANEILEILQISKDFNYQLDTATNEWVIK